MDRIRLPFVAGNATLSQVFTQMAESGEHAAIVAPPGRAPMLVTNREVDDAMENGLVTVGQLKGAPLHVSAFEPRDWEHALHEAEKLYGVLQDEVDALSDLDADTRVSDMDADDASEGGHGTTNRPRSDSRTITLVTGSERYAAEIRGAGAVCRCTENDHRVVGGSRCRICASDVRCA